MSSINDMIKFAYKITGNWNRSNIRILEEMSNRIRTTESKMIVEIIKSNMETEHKLIIALNLLEDHRDNERKLQHLLENSTEQINKFAMILNNPRVTEAVRTIGFDL